MPDDLAALAVDEGPGAFAPRKDLASPEAIVRLHARYVGADTLRAAAAARALADEQDEQERATSKKRKRKAARAARRRNRA